QGAGGSAPVAPGGRHPGTGQGRRAHRGAAAGPRLPPRLRGAPVVRRCGCLDCGTATEETPMPYELPSLPYAYNALEPTIDAQTMEIHHSKHHATYVNNLNAALESTKWMDR